MPNFFCVSCRKGSGFDVPLLTEKNGNRVALSIWKKQAIGYLETKYDERQVGCDWINTNETENRAKRCQIFGHRPQLFGLIDAPIVDVNDAKEALIMPSAPNTQSNPFGYVTPGDNTARVVYVGVKSHIHELRLPPGPNSAWFDTDLSSIAQGPTTAVGDPRAYVISSDNVPRVIYVADNHIHELRLPPGGKSPWVDADLSAIGQSSVGAQGGPFGYVTQSDGTARVVYLGTNLHIHELHLSPGAGWADADLSALGHSPTTSASNPSAYVTPDNTARVVYRGADGHVHELRLSPGAGWADADLSSIAKSGFIAAGVPFGYVTPDGTARVVYDGWVDPTPPFHVHELRLAPGGKSPWFDADLTSIGKSATKPAENPFAYVTPGDNTARVVYVGQDSHVHELHLPPGGKSPWTDADLSSIGKALTNAVGDTQAYVTSDNVPRVVYQGADHHIHELRLPPGGKSPWIDTDLTALA